MAFKRDLRSVESMADSTYKIDSPYCLTGRITRIIQTLENMDAENIVNIVSTDVIEREIAHKFPLLMIQYLKENENDKKLYEAPEAPEENEENKKVVSRIRNYVDSELRKEYLHNNILTQPTYEKITKVYFDNV